MNTILSKKELRIYRILAGFTAFAIVAIAYLLPAAPGTVDPVWLRWVLAIPIASLTIGSYFIPTIRNNYLSLTHVYAWICLIWLTWLAFENNLRIDYAPTVYVVLLLASFSFQRSRGMWFWMGSAFVASVALSFRAGETEFDPILFLLLEALMMLSLGLLMQLLLADRARTRTSHERQRAITVSAFEYSDEGIVVLDNDGKILEVNPRFLEMFQIKNEDIIAHDSEMPIPELLLQVRDPEKFQTLSAEGMALPEKFLFQEFQTMQGRHFSRFSKPLQMQGNTIGRIWFYQDQTNARQEQQQMKRKRELLEAENKVLADLAIHAHEGGFSDPTAIAKAAYSTIEILNASRISFWMLSGRDAHLSCLMIQTNGRIDRSLQGRRVAREQIEPFIKRLNNHRVFVYSGKKGVNDLRLLEDAIPELTSSPALVVPVRLSGKFKGFIFIQDFHPLREWSPDEIGFAGSLGDVAGMITESRQRHKSEEALRASLAENRSLIDAVPDMLVRLNSEGKVLALRIPDDPVYVHFHRLTPPESIHQLFPHDLCELIQQQLKSVQLRENTVTLLHQTELGGSQHDLELRLVPGGGKETLLVLRDDTARKKVERELIQRNFELDSFVYRASHDLKAPLNSLMGLLDIIQQEDNAPAVLKYLNLMDRSVVKMDQFIRNLTEFSRITRLKMQEESVDLREMIDEIFQDLQFLEGFQSIRRDIYIEPGIRLATDRFHFEIVLSNLISNAIKYQDHQRDDSFVRITARQLAKDFVIEVRDNGIGIPKAHQSRLFELFFRASNQSFGSGLGLYITQNAIEKMQGRLELESQEGRGTVFRILLPQHQPEVEVKVFSNSS